MPALQSVMIDSREPPEIQALRWEGVPAMVTALEAGDLWAACDDGALVIVERKTPSDFLNTLRDDRLFDQMARCRAISPWSYLVVAGRLSPGHDGTVLVDGRSSGWRWASVQGALVTCQELGVSVYEAASAEDYAIAVRQLAERSRQPVRLAPQRDVLIVDPAMHLLTSLPGIGAHHASALLRHCGTAAWSLCCLTEESRTEHVPGIGPIKRQQCRDVLGLSAGMTLAVVCTEDVGVSPDIVIAPHTKVERELTA